ncbi:predicted protein [Naegleria gruberi]|uniref:Predicted protein n=1 Tax=Naegleria gruberi TaxID=5762 RepID=D2VP55_NAEGR|nr:uncharacterized protein NAEGRDRAFT_70737 [Naegleria gruberi]EFC41372.1 predicted protein [Naegleria gruberi]|eukprot:XP_002674116.1 predicted protein [Naegleria gruberi strain NEG-M]
MVNQSSYYFTCDDGTGKPIEFILSYSEQIITISCTFNYHKYLFKEENTTIIHFKYYKTCMMNNNIRCSIANEGINLAVNASDDDQHVEFNLSQQERDNDEKLNIMFDVMMKEIKELKEKLWYTDKNLNKFSERYVSNWSSFQSNISRGLLLFGNKNKEHEIVSIQSELIVSNRKKRPFADNQNQYNVNITGFGPLDFYRNSGTDHFAYKEENLEPIIIYFKHPVAFSNIECLVDLDSSDCDVNIYIYGVVKPKGVVRPLGEIYYDKIPKGMNNQFCEPSVSPFFLMPQLTLLTEKSTKTKNLVSILIDTSIDFDGIGLAARKKERNHMDNWISVSFANIKIF